MVAQNRPTVDQAQQLLDVIEAKTLQGAPAVPGFAPAAPRAPTPPRTPTPPPRMPRLPRVAYNTVRASMKSSLP